MLRATFTTGELSPPEADAIASVQRRGAARPPHGEPQPDRFEYHLDLPGGKVVIGEDELPDSLRSLVSRLVERARRPPDPT